MTHLADRVRGLLRIAISNNWLISLDKLRLAFVLKTFSLPTKILHYTINPITFWTQVFSNMRAITSGIKWAKLLTTSFCNLKWE